MSHLAPSTQIIFPSETRNEHTLAARAYVAGAPGLTKKNGCHEIVPPVSCSSTIRQRLMVVTLTKLRPLPSGSSEREHEPSH